MNQPGVVAKDRRWSPVVWVFLALTGLWYLLTIPSWFLPAQLYDNLDGTWRALLNDEVGSGAQHGLDTIYTAGPLGFLRQSIYDPGTWKLHIGFGLFWGVVLLVAAAATLRRLDGPARWLAALWFLALPLVSGPAGNLVYPCALLLLYFVAAEDRPGLKIHEVALTVALAVGAHVIFTHVVLSLWTLAAVLVLVWLKDRRPSPLPLVWLGTYLAVWLALGQHLSTLPAYFSASLQMVSGYGEFMGQRGPLWETLAPLALFGLFGLLALYEAMSRRSLLLAVLLTGVAGVLFLSFKSAFVFPARPRILLPVTSFLTALVGYAVVRHGVTFAADPRTRRGAWALGAVTAVGFVVLLLFLGPGGAEKEERLANFVQNRARLYGLHWDALRDFDRQLEKFDARHERRKNLLREAEPLPDLEGPVDFYGDLGGILVAHDLDWRHRPVFQSFATYTPALAERNAAFYRGPDAPPTVIAGIRIFGNYPVTLPDARALLELWSRYEPVGRANRRLVLQRRETPREVRKELVLERTARLGEEVSLEPHDAASPLWVEIGVEPTLMGRLGSFLVRPGGLRIETWTASGRRMATRRFAAKTAEGGFLISPLPRDNQTMLQFFEQGDAPPTPEFRVSKLRIFDSDPERPVDLWGEVHVRLFSLELVGDEPPGTPDPLSSRAPRRPPT